MPLELLEGSPIRLVANVHRLVAHGRIGPWVASAIAQPFLLNVGADVEVELDDERAIVALLRLEFVDFVERTRDPRLVGSPQDAVVEDPPVPTAKEDCRVAGARQLPPETRQPMTFGGFATVVANAMHRHLAGIESRDELS